MKRKNKIGILTSISMLFGKIVYGINLPVQTDYGIESIQTFYGVRATPIEENANALLTIGKIAIIPVVLLVGIFVVVKIKKIRNKKEKKINEEEK